MTRICIALVALALLAPASQAQLRGFVVEPPEGTAGPLDLVDLVRAENPNAEFEVAIVGGGPGGVAREGELVQFRIRSERAGYVTLVSRSPDGHVTLLYPNKFAPAERVEAGEEVVLPREGDFRIRVTPPFGQEHVKVLVTPQPLIDAEQAKAFWKGSPLVSVEGAPEQAGTNDLNGYDRSRWTAASLYVTTAPAGSPAGEAVEPPPVPRDRFGDNPRSRWRADFRRARGLRPLAGRSLDAPTEEAEALEASAGAEAPEDPLAVHDSTILVLYKPTVGTRSFGRSMEGGGLFNQLRVVDPRRDRTDYAGTRSLGGAYGAGFEDVLEGLQADPDVLVAVPNYEVRAFEPVVSRTLPVAPADSLAADQFWPLQWALHNAFWRSAEDRADVRWREALAHYRRPQQPVVVAVVDTGVFPENPHLAPVLWRNEDEVPGNGIDDDGNGYVDDTWGWDTLAGDNDPTDNRTNNSHGTFCATQIAGGFEGSVIRSMAPDVRIMAVRALGREPGEAEAKQAGGGGGGTVDYASSYVGGGEKRGSYRSIIEGIRYAAQNGARVINLSLGSGPTRERIPHLERMLHRVFEEAEKLGALVVIAAGNERADSRKTYTYPARISRPNTLSVASIGLSGRMSGFSNRGPDVDLAAPGDYIVGHAGSTLEVKEMSGTSMAAPYVAAVAAMLFAKHPDWTPAQVKEAILASARPVDRLDVRSGAVLDAGAALQR